MRIVIAGLKEESNSFSPVVCTADFFGTKAPSTEGEELITVNEYASTCLDGMISVIKEQGDEIIPVVDWSSVSSGPVDRHVADDFIAKVNAAVNANAPVDGIFLALHGGMTLTDADDGCGVILEKIRENAGPKPVIACSSDLHANVTKKWFANADFVTGYQTYPHVDFFETGARAARLAYKKLNGEKIYEACVRVPMIVPAETYSTASGKFADLINEAHSVRNEGKILDFSIYMMQPWLNVEDAGSSVLIVAEEKETAAKYAQYFAKKLYSLRKEFAIKLWKLDEVIDIAEENEKDMPVILVDSADSPNAGSAADSTEVLRRICERKSSLKTAICISDAPAVEKAFQAGVGGSDEFTLGATCDKIYQRSYTVRAYVKSLHDGDYLMEGPAERGNTKCAGRTAVLKVGNIDIVVCTRMPNSSDPQLYRGFGIEPSLYDLVVVKSATQYKTPYLKFSSLFYPTDTPGASSANLTSLKFDKLPRPFWPFDDEEEFDTSVFYAL